METPDLAPLYHKLSTSFVIYEKYLWLLNCYVLDFFTENHWNKLQNSWRSSLKTLSSFEIGELLDYDHEMSSRVWPLSILALKKILNTLSLPRKMSTLNIQSPYFASDEKLLKLFWKNVKAKKRHEISIMSKICYESALKTDCFFIVDIGSGQGHLSRILNYGYHFSVCTIEAQEVLSKQAKVLDEEFESSLKRKFKNQKCHQTVHVCKKIETAITASDFLKIIEAAFNVNNTDFKFGIVGLHPCGDLGATLLKLYNQCDRVKFINLVGCCYMKLTTKPEVNYGFPLSTYCILNNFNLSYHSREIACHAIENYIEKLNKNECWRLKIHTYRAVLEKIISKKCPNHHHSALNNVKYNEDLSFEDYCSKATKKINLDFSKDNLQSDEIKNLLSQWKQVVVFYSLRLLFAPLIESIILLDRFLFVLESGSTAEIISAFDAKISPRTHVLTARKMTINRD